MGCIQNFAHRTSVWLVFCAIHLCFLHGAQARQANSVGDELAAGIEAYSAEAPFDAESHFKNALSSGSDEARAHYWLAKLYLDPPFQKASEAFKHLREARRLESDNIDFLRERLRQLRSGYTFFGTPSGRSRERPRLARQIVTLDSTAVEGYFEAGNAYRDEFELYRSVHAFEMGGGEWTINPANWDQERAHEAYESALSNYDRAIERSPENLDLLRSKLILLIRAATSFPSESAQIHQRALDSVDRLTRSFPRSAQAWKLSGLIEYLSGCVECAASRFDQALALMSAEERETFDVVEILLNRDAPRQPGMMSDTDTAGFWKSRDPMHLTRANERQASHYARIVYSDLLYPKWRTLLYDNDYITPGEIIVRYGIPNPRESRIAPRISSQKLEYFPPMLSIIVRSIRELFLFQDEFGNGEWSIFSQRSEFDPVTHATGIFHEIPELPDTPGPGTFEMPFQYWRMRDAEGGSEVVVAYGIPVNTEGVDGDIPLAIETGVFLVDAAGENVDATADIHSALGRNQVVAIDTLSVWTDVKTLHVLRKGPLTLQVEGRGNSVTSTNAMAIEVDSVRAGFGVSDPVLAFGIEDVVGGASGDAPGNGFGDVPPGNARPGTVVRGGLAIRPVPLPVFSPQAPIYVYYEVYDLQTDPQGSAAYQTEVILAPVSEGGVFRRLADLIQGKDDLPVAVSFDSRIQAAADNQYQILDLSEYDAGIYRLIVRITDQESGRVAASEKRILLK